MDSPDELADALIRRLEERGAPAAIALADLMMLEHHLADSLRLVRGQIDALVRQAAVEGRQP